MPDPLDCATPWALQITYLSRRRHLFICSLCCSHSIIGQAPEPWRLSQERQATCLAHNQSFTPICSAVGISSILNYHTCQPAPGRMNGTAHIVLQSQFLSKYPLWISEEQRTLRGTSAKGRRERASWGEWGRPCQLCPWVVESSQGT